MRSLLGVDIETTGTDPAIHSLIQIGVHDPVSGRSFISDVRPDTPFSEKEALEVNGFTPERMAAAPTPTDVDSLLFAFIEARGFHEGEAVPVGWNVGGFDMAFIKRQFPLSFDLFNYRVVELNSICTAIAEAGIATYNDAKFGAKRNAKRLLGEARKEHDAGSDAEASLLEFSYLVGMIKYRVY